MKIKQLIQKLQMHDLDSEVVVQDYNWNEYELGLATGGGGQMVFVVSPINMEDEE